MSTPNQSLIIVKEPQGMPKYGEDLKLVDSSINLESADLQGGILLKTITMSLDPTLRNSMRIGQKSYARHYEAGKPIWGFGVSEVLRSEHPKWKKGDLLHSRETIMAQYSVLTGAQVDASTDEFFAKVDRVPELNITNYVSAAGMPGMTAWMSLKAIIGDFKKDSTIFVTSAAGAVGSLVCQLAKEAGSKVIASAGSDDKVRFLQEDCHVDRAFNYKTADVNAELAAFGGEKGIDYFFDNVGGPQLEAYLNHAAVYGVVIVCGVISAYNATADSPAPAIKNFPTSVLVKQLTVRGFIVSSFLKEQRETFFKSMPGLLRDGKIKFREDVREGMDALGPGMVDLLKGDHNGKMVVL
ncbi:NAD(P)-binding protein [Microstroma glucosiphilum]|uniref:NAD(P)-binding protein n=1 Tax=Pseudomicrostroma glucosiphilum TaxID=1684307 RepID=A0A316U5G7_9BASI|nr:NAD(P)-binding protein [Pseudomicrostroma glucosiphilum]PWN20084.1 NAD(P)-binding protein [Pseudomicrostroma glucosiphilum]